MKPTLRDYLTISMALLAIFLCGYGVGFLLGEKNGREKSEGYTLANTSDQDAADWEKRTFDRLSGFLELSEEQKESVQREVEMTSSNIQQSREKTVEDYFLQVLNLHDRILPYLEPDQQEKIKKDRKSLQRAIDLRFKSHAER